MEKELKDAAAAAAEALTSSGGASAPQPGGGSQTRMLPERVRAAVIDVRTRLYQRGIVDPLLARFDSATVAPASDIEISERLAAIAQSA